MWRSRAGDQSASAVAALGKYGLGTRRSLHEYIAFCGIDTIQQKIDANCVVKYQVWPSVRVGVGACGWGGGRVCVPVYAMGLRSDRAISVPIYCTPRSYPPCCRLIV